MQPTNDLRQQPWIVDPAKALHKRYSFVKFQLDSLFFDSLIQHSALAYSSWGSLEEMSRGVMDQYSLQYSTCPCWYVSGLPKFFPDTPPDKGWLAGGFLFHFAA